MSSSLYSRLHGVFTKTPRPKPIPTITTTITPPPAAAASAAAAAASAAANSTKPKISTPFTTTTTKATTKVSNIVKNFKRNSRSITFRRNQETYEATVRRLAVRQQFSAIENIIEHQKKYKESITDEGFAVRLISLYGKAKMFDQARKLFDELPSLECNRTVMSFNALLFACVNSKKYDKISEIFKEIPEKLSIEPDTVSYNTVIKAFCDMGALDSAITVIDEMEKNGVKPDLITYNTVLEAYYKNNRFSEAEKLWDLMEEKNLVANVRSYNSKLRGLVGNNQVLEAVKLMEEMEEKEVKPDTYSYNAVIKGFVDDDNLEEAKRLYAKMVENGCVPDHLTFGMLIQFACDKDDFDYALELCKKIIELKQYIYHSLMQKVVDGLLVRSRVEEAKELVELVDSSSILGFKLKMPVTE